MLRTALKTFILWLMVLSSYFMISGRVQSVHFKRVTAENLNPIIKQTVAEWAHLIGVQSIMTDTSTVLTSAGSKRTHDKVNHSKDEYVRYENGICITTNGIEGYFANVKRAIKGIYPHVGKQHLHRYLTEFDFRYNSRKVEDGTRTL